MFDGFREKANEMWQWMMELEGTKYDLSEKFKRQKYDVSHLKHKPSKIWPKRKIILG